MKDNGLENVITIIKGKVEEVELPVDGVDIIISEWMGYFLLYESMLLTVLDARDRWLKPGGMLFPDKASIYISAIEDADYKESKVDFWDSVHGVDMSCVKNMVISEPLVDVTEQQAIFTTSCPIFSINLETVDRSQLNFVSTYRLTATRNDYFYALVAWFDVDFTHGKQPIKLSTCNIHLSPSSQIHSLEADSILHRKGFANDVRRRNHRIFRSSQQPRAPA